MLAPCKTFPLPAPAHAGRPRVVLQRAACRLRGQIKLSAQVTAQEMVPQSAAPAAAAHVPLPTSYQRLVARTTGQSFHEVAAVESVPLRLPVEGEVLVKVHYAGINGGCETFRARGEFAFSSNRGLQNFPLGAEGAGVVAAVGPGVTNVKVGQHVACNGGSAFAEYAYVKAHMCTPVIEANAQAVALVLSGVTACVALQATAKLQAGEMVLVTAAAGGTGHFAVQLAKLAGCHVIAVCGGPRKAENLRKLGVDCVIDYKAEDVGNVLASKYPGGVDVVYEGVGGSLQRTLLHHLSPKGRLLQVGYISEYPHTQQAKSSDDAQHGSDVDAASSNGSSPGGSSSISSSRPVSTSGHVSNPAGGSSGRAEINRNGAAIGSSGVADGSSTGNNGSSTAAGGSSNDRHSSHGDQHPVEEGEVPPCSQLFWKGLNIQRGSQQIIGQIWPKDVKAIMRCRKQVFDLYASGKLQVWVDESHGFRGVQQVPDAIDYMLQGGHIGKVVIAI